MKKLFSAVLLVFLLGGCADSDQVESHTGEDQLPSDLTREEESLLRDVRQMFERHDISIMMDRVHKAGVADDFWMKIEEDSWQDILESGLGHITLERIDPPKIEESLPDGSVAQWSLPLKWRLMIYHPKDAWGISVSHTIALSDHEGRIVSIRQILKK